MLCFVASMSLIFAACEKPEDPNGNDPGQPTMASILGTWEADKVVQNPETEHPVDMTTWYQNFQLTFLEDGTLITSDGINESTMAWTLDGDQLAFIQVPGAQPVMYIVRTLTETNLVMETGTGSDYVTVWEMHRVK